MAKVLTSWKEIAQYLGKGVRTVQRWEAEFGLPVRRPMSENHRAVLAIAEELDNWARSQQSRTNLDAEGVWDELARLREENVRLREWLLNALAQGRIAEKSDLFSGSGRKSAADGEPRPVEADATWDRCEEIRLTAHSCVWQRSGLQSDGA